MWKRGYKGKERIRAELIAQAPKILADYAQAIDASAGGEAAEAAAQLKAEIKAIIDRSGMVSRANNHLLKRKVGAAVIAVRRAGAIHVFDTINHFFTISQMIIPGSSYWNIGIGREKGEVDNDREGIETMRTLGQNMAWL
jgi:hypothetical protein